MKSTTVQEKIKFLLCETSLSEEKFVLQVANPQYMFQVLCFDSREQYNEFQRVNQEPFGRLDGYLIILRLSSALQPVSVNQQNADAVFDETMKVMNEAARWFAQEYIEKRETIYSNYKEEKE